MLVGFTLILKKVRDYIQIRVGLRLFPHVEHHVAHEEGQRLYPDQSRIKTQLLNVPF